MYTILFLIVIFVVGVIVQAFFKKPNGKIAAITYGLMFLSVLFVNFSGLFDEEVYKAPGEDFACVVSEDFIKEQLNYPADAEFSLMDCIKKSDSTGSVTVWNKVVLKNSFGVKKDYIFKLKLVYLGGVEIEKKNWTLISIHSEEYRP